jgi:hypothetical protein
MARSSNSVQHHRVRSRHEKVDRSMKVSTLVVVTEPTAVMKKEFPAAGSDEYGQSPSKSALRRRVADGSEGSCALRILYPKNG